MHQAFNDIVGNRDGMSIRRLLIVGSKTTNVEHFRFCLCGPVSLITRAVWLSDCFGYQGPSDWGCSSLDLDIIDVLPHAKILGLHTMHDAFTIGEPLAFFRKYHTQEPQENSGARIANGFS